MPTAKASKAGWLASVPHKVPIVRQLPATPTHTRFLIFCVSCSLPPAASHAMDHILICPGSLLLNHQRPNHKPAVQPMAMCRWSTTKYSPMSHLIAHIFVLISFAKHSYVLHALGVPLVCLLQVAWKPPPLLCPLLPTSTWVGWRERFGDLQQNRMMMVVGICMDSLQFPTVATSLSSWT